MTSLDELLEVCLQELESGRPIDSIVRRHPEHAAELRRLLVSAQAARAAAVGTVPLSLGRTSRARLLRRAAAMRTEGASPRRRAIAPQLRVAMSLALVIILAFTSTRLVRASSGALPGDQLYSVKRSWEDVQLFFVFQFEDHELLESRFTQERLDETHRLLAQGRSAPITFSGLVMRQQDGSWLVSGIRVSITANTVMPNRPIGASEPVTITGITRSDGTLVADEVQLLSPGAALPPLEPSDHEGGETAGEAPPAGPSGTSPVTTPGPGAASQQTSYRFSGVVGAMQGAAWIVNGQPVHLADNAQVNGTVKIGSIVTFEGYYSSSGRFEVTSVDVNWSPQAKSGSSSDSGASGGQSGGDSGGDGGSDDGESSH